jgi:dihydrodipicolinate synthase/N-acetylneuraminate lyase
MTTRAPAVPETRTLPSANTEDGRALARAYDAFDRGDFREARALAKTLTKVIDVDVRRSAESLVEKLGIDPIAVAVWAVCFGFFVWTAVRYLS